jgi:hypothetical protein
VGEAGKAAAMVLLLLMMMMLDAALLCVMIKELCSMQHRYPRSSGHAGQKAGMRHDVSALTAVW